MFVSQTLTSISYFPNLVSSRICKDYSVTLQIHEYVGMLDNVWGPRLTTRDSRYAYNSRSQETVVNPHNRVGISDYNIHCITSIKVLHKPLG
jgi:hypothetical protein